MGYPELHFLYINIFVLFYLRSVHRVGRARVYMQLAWSCYLSVGSFQRRNLSSRCFFEDAEVPCACSGGFPHNSSQVVYPVFKFFQCHILFISTYNFFFLACKIRILAGNLVAIFSFTAIYSAVAGDQFSIRSQNLRKFFSLIT